MEFCIEKHSSISPIKQIEEQIKLAIAMGTFRRGDTLPSIRDVEKQTGINRGQIHRAYRALRRSGLLALTRGKGTVVSAAVSSHHYLNEECLKLSKTIISKVRIFGVSPAAFGRYFNQQALLAEHGAPFIAYVDDKKEIAEQRAAEVSGLWQVPVIGLTIKELNKAVGSNSGPRKILANHLRSNYIRSQIRGGKTDVIPMEVRYTEQIIRDLARIKPNSSVLRVLAPAYAANARFIIAQLRKWVKSPGVEISAVSVREVASFKELLNGSRYDRIILDPGTLSDVPPNLRRNAHIMLVRLQLDPASLEAARIRAGVII